MKAVQFSKIGAPEEVCDIVELDEPPAPGKGEVLLEVLYSPINPADLLLLSGRYGSSLPKLPLIAGGEGLCRVAALGPGVDSFAVGDLTLFPGRGAWRERIVAPAAALVHLPGDGDPAQLAMLRVNPATAYLMLKQFVELTPGDWVIQNAANSGVGHATITLAREMGVRTLNVVRRDDVEAELGALGADAVLVDGPDLAERVAAIVGDGKVKLALDAVGGEATERLASALSDGGTVVNYGLLSGENCQLSSRNVVFRNIALRGFWLAPWFGTASADEISTLYIELARYVAAGTIHVPVEKIYPFEELGDALRHAGRPGRGGKILLRFAAA
ncbi:zinc-dependent alcohol dehydrogenase family protein [Oceanibacterium hippocampi]|uniref:enoyl-[acyl-carrier-protein] reductase n=1 Tax=Oceanibacterium hippocampi TaxID=745714 RepID=A0A1Y5RAX7_9PROT|nr:zinc-dependent alcohol dehydrogenase family protein [Oceanibacterium hippocampi]SLN12437.1 Quinone oxidoreductase 1 [Oceanibacterium hippocampi]